MDADNRRKTDNAAGPSAPGPDSEWTKEQPGRDRPFDFDAFLGQKSLEDQVTDALDGKDLLDGEAYGQYPPGYIPRRAGAADGRGRHEAPGSGPEPDPEPEYPGEPPTQRFTRDGEIVPPRQSQQPPRQDRQTQSTGPQQPPRTPRPNEPPPRPKVVVAEPAPRVVVTPDRQYTDAEKSAKGMGKGAKFLIALLITVAVVLALAVLALQLLPGGTSQDPNAPAPSPTDYLFGGLPTRAPAVPTAPPAPTAPPVTDPPMPTPAPVVYYTISVTAGPGGSVSPNGMVDVQEGESATFSILPEMGYELGQLLIDGVNVSVTESYTFTDVRQNHTLYAVFQQLLPTQPPVTEAPVIPDVPDVPDVPVAPDDPQVPDVPVTPEDQGVPDIPPMVEG